MMDSRSPWWRLLLSPGGWLALGMIVRLVHVLSLGNEYFFGDTAEYEQVALRILHGQGLGESSPRAPLYPLLMALSFWLGGEQNFIVMRWFQLVLAFVQMRLVVRLANRIGGLAASAFAAPLIALTPTVVFSAGLLYPTLLYSTLLFSVTLLAWEIADRPTTGRGVALGVLLVLAWLTDMVVLAPALAIGTWLLAQARRQPGPLWRALAVTLVTGLAIVVPYAMRLRAQGGDRVFMGKAQAVLYFARTDTLISRPRWIRTPPGEPFTSLSATAFVARETRLFRARPGAYVHDYVMEFLHFFQPLPDRVTSKNRYNRPWVLWVGAAWFLLLLPTTILGLLRARAPRSGRLLLAAVVITTAAFYACFFTQTRYRIPVEPQMVVLAALALATAFPRLGRVWADPSAAETDPHR